MKELRAHLEVLEAEHGYQSAHKESLIGKKRVKKVKRARVLKKKTLNVTGAKRRKR